MVKRKKQAHVALKGLGIKFGVLYVKDTEWHTIH